jgi:RNA polymerase sigma-70 factor (ECF subfamily)
MHVPGAWQLLPVRANGQPAVAAYLRREDGVHRAHSIQVLTLRDGEIAGISAFLDASLFPVFGLPLVHP